MQILSSGPRILTGSQAGHCSQFQEAATPVNREQPDQRPSDVGTQRPSFLASLGQL